MTNLLAYPAAGSVVSVATHLLYRHKGIVSDRWSNGRPMVISGSARTGVVVEENWETFAQGRPVRLDLPSGAGTSAQVVHRARSHLGKRYHLFNWNCEHLVAAAHGQTPSSPQLAATLLIGMIVLLASAK